LRIPQYSGREFPSPEEVVVYSFGLVNGTQNPDSEAEAGNAGLQPATNSWLQTHQDDGTQGGARNGFPAQEAVRHPACSFFSKTTSCGSY
jgi:hypothetical protein